MKDGLVRSVDEWLGFLIGPQHWGEELTFVRPDFYFDEDTWPEEATIVPEPPTMCDGRTLEELRRDAMRDVRQRAKELRRARVSEDGEFIGMETLRTRSIDDSPTSDPGAWELIPRYKAKGENAEETKLMAIQRYDWWLRNYRRAKESPMSSWFPEGTEKYLRLKLARVHPRRNYGFYALARAAP